MIELIVTSFVLLGAVSLLVLLTVMFVKIFKKEETLW